jgi:hypothetical protein
LIEDFVVLVEAQNLKHKLLNNIMLITTIKFVKNLTGFYLPKHFVNTSRVFRWLFVLGGIKGLITPTTFGTIRQHLLLVRII